MEPKQILLPFSLTYRSAHDFLAAAPGSWEHTLLRTYIKRLGACQAAEKLSGYYWDAQDASDSENPSTPSGAFPDVWACRAHALVTLGEGWHDFPATAPSPDVLVFVETRSGQQLTARYTKNRVGEPSWSSGLVYPNGEIIYIREVTKWRWL